MSKANMDKPGAAGPGKGADDSDVVKKAGSQSFGTGTAPFEVHDVPKGGKTVSPMPSRASQGDEKKDEAEEAEDHVEQAVKDESESEGEEEEVQLAPDHPLLAGPQAAMRDQLTRMIEKTTLELREKEETLGQLKKQREDIGVSLYGFQQQLARLQQTLEQVHDRFTTFTQQREQADENLKGVTVAHETKKKEVSAMATQVAQSQAELDQLKIALKQVEQFNEQEKSRILVQRKETSTLEDQMQKLELEKKKQDLLIDSMNEQLRSLAEQTKLVEAQIEAQKQETLAAAATLADARKEMEAIALEKKNYMQQWRAVLLGTQRRDEALQLANKANQEQREKITNLEAEINGYKLSIRQEHEKNEQLTSVIRRLQGEYTFIQNQLTEAEERKAQLGQDFLMLSKSLQEKEAETKKAEAEARDIQRALDQMDVSIQKATQENQQIQSRMIENISQQTTVEKGAQNVFKAARKLQREVEEKEQKVAEITNEVARIKIDSLNTQAHNRELKTELDQLIANVKEKDQLIQKYEQEIRQRHDEIEKKQIYVDRLHKQLDAYTSKMEDENTGPLEATIKNLTKEIQSTLKDTGDLQRTWLKGQTELVDITATVEKEEENVAELKARRTILNQKRVRLDAQKVAEAEEVAELTKGVRAMHNDMTQLNALIAKDTARKDALTNQLFVSEREFSQRLKELETESIEMEKKIEATREEKELLLQDIIEMQRQCMFWDRKINLEKESQQAVDPAYGRAEVEGMKKEIHRMELRLAQLKRKQEEIIQEIERAISKRELIELRGQSTSKAVAANTNATLKQKIMSLKQQMQKNSKEMEKTDKEIMEQEKQNQELLAQVEQLQAQYNQLEDKKIDLVAKIDDAYLQKQANLERITQLQQRAKRYEAVAAGSYRPSGTPAEVSESLKTHVQQTEKIRQVLGKLRDENPKYQHWFKRLLGFIN